jgi:hypothetical protein
MSATSNCGTRKLEGTLRVIVMVSVIYRLSQLFFEPCQFILTVFDILLMGINCGFGKLHYKSQRRHHHLFSVELQGNLTHGLGTKKSIYPVGLRTFQRVLQPPVSARLRCATMHPRPLHGADTPDAIFLYLCTVFCPLTVIKRMRHKLDYDEQGTDLLETLFNRS